jgi:pimeloyl-ACP methyl ester carboxylesterase
MKKTYLLLLLFTFYSLIGFSQTANFTVAPNLVDAGYSTTDENHFIVRNTTTHLNKLVLFIGGSFSVPANYSTFCTYPASIGFDVISLSYPNDVAAASLENSSDLLAFDNFREEIAFGTQVSNAVNVNVLNCITVRAVKLIQYLNTTYPNQNWGQYLATATTLDWSKIVVAGHSQGAGHACYLGKKRAVERVLMFSGPNDYHTYYNAAANWLSQTGITTINKQFALLHQQDQIIPFASQSANLQALGMNSLYTPTLVDNLSAPYGNSHLLNLNIPALSQHNSTIGTNAILPNVWNYMLTSATTLGTNALETSNKKITVYPNPTSSEIKISNLENETTIRIFNSFGNKVLETKSNSFESISLDQLCNGLYFLKVENQIFKIIKK